MLITFNSLVYNFDTCIAVANDDDFKPNSVTILRATLLKSLLKIEDIADCKYPTNKCSHLLVLARFKRKDKSKNNPN